MKNGTLQRRLAAIEAKSHEVAEAIERGRTLPEERSISVEEAERTYRRLMAPAPRIRGPRKLSLDQVMARYFQMVRGPAPSQGKRC